MMSVFGNFIIKTLFSGFYVKYYMTTIPDRVLFFRDSLFLFHVKYIVFFLHFSQMCTRIKMLFFPSLKKIKIYFFNLSSDKPFLINSCLNLSVDNQILIEFNALTQQPAGYNIYCLHSLRQSRSILCNKTANRILNIICINIVIQFLIF